MGMSEIFAMLAGGKNVEVNILGNEDLDQVSVSNSLDTECEPKKDLLQNIIELLDKDRDVKLDPELRQEFVDIKNQLEAGTYSGDEEPLSFCVTFAKIFHSFMERSYDSYIGKYHWKDFIIDEISHDVQPRDMILEVAGIDIGDDEIAITTCASASMNGKHRISLTNVVWMADDKYLSKFVLNLPDLS